MKFLLTKDEIKDIIDEELWRAQNIDGKAFLSLTS
jgi:hypothetical protein